MPRPAIEDAGRQGTRTPATTTDHVQAFLRGLRLPWLLLGGASLALFTVQLWLSGQPMARMTQYVAGWLMGSAILLTRSLGPRARAILIVALFCVVGSIALARAPLLPAGILYGGAGVLVASVAFGYRGMAAALGLVGGAYILVAAGFVTGALPLPDPHWANPRDWRNWFRAGLGSLLPLATVAVGIVTILRSHRAAWSQARGSETRYRTLFDGSGDAILILKQGRFVECNREAVEVFGYAEEELLGKQPSDVSPERQPDGRLSTEKAEGLFVAALAGHSQRFPWTNRRRDGTEFDVEVTLNSLVLDGEPCFLAIVRNVSERLRAEEALRASEERYRSIVETTSEWVWELDLEGRHSYSNPAVEEILGYRADEIVGRDCFPMIHPQDRPLAQQLVASSLSSGHGWRGRLIRWRHKRGHYRTLESSAVLSRDTSGGAAGFRGTDRDVTERIEAQEALRQSEERYRIVSELTSDFAYAFKVAPDGDVQVDWITDAVVRITGYSKRELAGGWRILIHGDDRPVTARQFEALRAGRASTAEFRIVRKDGAIAWVRNHATPFWSASEQRTVRIFGAIQDVTAQHAAEVEQRRLAEELRRLHTRLETVRTDESRRMARRVHDDVGQRLTALQFDLVQLRRECGSEPGDRRERLEAASRVLAETLETVRGISQELHPRILDDLGLAAALRAHARALCTRAGLAWHVDVVPEDLSLDRRMSEALYHIYREAVTNVVRHANAKSVWISVRAAANAVELAVEDDGRGLPETAAATPQSLGLLYMRESARSLGGTCEVATRASGGTIVMARIPPAESPVTTPSGSG